MLRFPYSDGKDENAIRPYIALLFNDLSCGEISEKEQFLIESAGVSTASDIARLPISYMTKYLVQKFNMSVNHAELLFLSASQSPGIYLPESDAWFIPKIQNAMQEYCIESGEILEDGTYVLSYSAPKLFVQSEMGFTTISDQPMKLTVAPSEATAGEWVVISNIID